MPCIISGTYKTGTGVALGHGTVMAQPATLPFFNRVSSVWITTASHYPSTRTALDGTWSLTLPQGTGSESDPASIEWIITLPSGQQWQGVVPTLNGPVDLHDLKNSHDWAYITPQVVTPGTVVQGPPGMVNRGAYDATATYVVDDAVSYNGAYYIALAINGPSNGGTITPGTNGAVWQLVAQAGAIATPQTQNTIYAGPTSGTSAPAFRAMDPTDMPTASITAPTTRGAIVKTSHYLSDYASLPAALTAIGATKATLVVHQSATGIASLTVPATLTLEFRNGATLQPASGQTLTLNGPIAAATVQIFDTSLGGSIKFGDRAVHDVPVEWFGASSTSSDSGPAINAAIAALPAASGGRVVALGQSYTLNTTVLLSAVQGVQLVGSGRYGTTFNTGTSLTGLPVIQLVDCRFCTVADLSIAGNASHMPDCGIQSLRSAASPTYNGAYHTFRNLIIGSTTTNCLGYGIRYTAANSAADTNNEQGTFLDVTIQNCLNYGYSIEHQNSLWHRIVGGIVQGCGQGIAQFYGGSLAAYGLVSNNNGNSSTGGYDWLFNVPNFSGVYQYGSSLFNVNAEGGFTALVSSPATGANVAFYGCKKKNEVATQTAFVSFATTGGRLTMDHCSFDTANGSTSMTFSDTASSVTIRNSTIGVHAITYNGRLTLGGNVWKQSSTFTAGSVSELIQEAESGLSSTVQTRRGAGGQTVQSQTLAATTSNPAYDVQRTGAAAGNTYTGPTLRVIDAPSDGDTQTNAFEVQTKVAGSTSARFRVDQYGHLVTLSAGTPIVYMKNATTGPNAVEDPTTTPSVHTTAGSISTQSGDYVWCAVSYVDAMPATLGAPTAGTPSGTGSSFAGGTPYLWAVTAYQSGGTETTIGTASASKTPTAGQNVALTAIPLAPGVATGRKVYRSADAGATWGLVNTLADNTTTTWTDTGVVAGASPPGSNTFPTTGETHVGPPVKLVFSGSGQGVLYDAVVVPVTGQAVTNVQYYLSALNGTSTALTLQTNTVVSGGSAAATTIASLAAGTAAPTTNKTSVGGTNPTAAITGNDIAGLVTFTPTGGGTMPGSAYAGVLFFANPYAAAPKAVLVSATANSATLQAIGTNLTTTNWFLLAHVAQVNAVPESYYYLVMG